MNRLLFLQGFLMVIVGCAGQSPHRTNLLTDSTGLERVRQQLVAPPLLPVHAQVAIGSPKIIEVRLTVEEKEINIGNGAKVQAATFNGSIPGPAIVVHQNDYLELTLTNPKTNTMVHSIDLHAATGALGGAV